MTRNRNLRNLVCLVCLAGLLLLGAFMAWSQIGTGRVLKLEAAYPTETKPQSKMWFAHGRWWAWLPDAQGSSIWSRVRGRWVREESLDTWLAQIPGHADVWADAEGVCAVIVGREQVAVARLKFDAQSSAYTPVGDAVIWTIENNSSKKPTALSGITARWRSQLAAAPVQCATITREAGGLWWVAYDYQGQIWVRRSLDTSAASWEAPVPISQALAGDDLSAIFTLRDGIGVVWTDQARNAIQFRHHQKGVPSDQWDAIETIAEEEQIANNHLHAAVARDGAAYVVSKSARYEIERPLLSLRMRHPDGRWESTSYANYSAAHTPTRPIAMLTPDEAGLWLVNAVLDNSSRNAHCAEARFVCAPGWKPPPESVPVISPHLDLQNPTSCKNRLPADGPWIVLGSDRFGNVFEGFLPKPAE